MWYEQLLAVHSNDDIRTMLYTQDKDSAFLELPVLPDAALRQIIGDFAKAKQKVLSVEDQEQILEYCKKRLLVYATATGEWRIKDPLPEYLQTDFVSVKEFCMTRDKQDQLLRSVNEKFEWDGILSPLEPDLIRELFVLEYLQNAFEAEKMIEAFHTSKKYLLFLFRSIQDYADVDKYAHLFSDGLKTLLKESLIRKIPELYAYVV